MLSLILNKKVMITNHQLLSQTFMKSLKTDDDDSLSNQYTQTSESLTHIKLQKNEK